MVSTLDMTNHALRVVRALRRRRDLAMAKTSKTALANRVRELRMPFSDGTPVVTLENSHFSGLLANTKRQNDLQYSFVELLRRQLCLHTPEQRWIDWLSTCVGWSKVLGGDLANMISGVRDEKRRLSPFPEDPSIEVLGEEITQALALLDSGRQKFLRALQGFSAQQPYKNPVVAIVWDSKQERDARRILRKLQDNAQRILPPLKAAFPDEKLELDWIVLRVEQFGRALWTLHENLAGFVPMHYTQNCAMDKALHEIFFLTSWRHVGMERFIEHCESSAPDEARQIVSDSFNPGQGNWSSPRFAMRKYRWHDDEKGDFPGDMVADLACISSALDQFSPLGQSFVTVSALQQALCDLPKRYALDPHLRSKGPITRPIICEMDFEGRSSVMPKSWPLETGKDS